MKPVTAPEDLDFEMLPTFDQLKEESGFKVSFLREVLRPVPCWKCTDNTVRYDAAASAEALSGAAAEKEAAKEDERAASIEMLKTDGGMSLLLMVLNKVTAILGAQQKEKNDTIKAMGEPLRVGVEMLQRAADRLEKRASELEENRDKVFRLIEDALSARNDRELSQQRQTAQIQMRQEAVEMLKGQVPSIVAKWGLTSQATMALDFIGSLHPLMIDQVISSGVLEPKQVEQLKALRAHLASKDGAAAPSSAPPPDQPPKKEGASDEPKHGNESPSAHG